MTTSKAEKAEASELKTDSSNEEKPSTDAKVNEEPIPGYFAHWIPVSIMAAIIIGVDHLSKYLAIVHLDKVDDMGRRVTVTIIPNFFQLFYAENRGAAFSIADGKTGLLAIVSIIASIFVVYFFTRLPAEEKLGRFALGMVFAGAIGNFIDRAFRGFVVDFFDVYVGSYHWPTFNVADSFICIGVGILALQIFRGKV